MDNQSEVDIFGEPVEPMSGEAAERTIRQAIYAGVVKDIQATYDALMMLDADAKALAAHILRETYHAVPEQMTLGPVHTLATALYHRMTPDERDNDYARAADALARYDATLGYVQERA